MPSPCEIAQQVPDVPRFVEVRAMLMQDEYEVFGSMDDGVVVLSKRTFLAAVIGEPTAEAMDEAVRRARPDAEMLVVPESVEHVRRLLPYWKAFPATIHALPEPIAPDRSEFRDVVLFDPMGDDALSQFTHASLQKEVRYAGVAAAKRIGGEFVSVCAASYVGETLWDVGVDTLAEHRRQGYARECYLVLARHLAGKGKQPVWGSLDENIASMTMAKSLGFVAVDRLHIFVPPKSLERVVR